jgi:hypothetical protein
LSGAKIWNFAPQQPAPIPLWLAKAWGYLIQFPHPNSEVEMPVSAISFYRGGTIEDVTPLAKRMKAVLIKYGVAYQVSRFQTGQNVGEWMVVVQYSDWIAYAKAQDSFAHDPEHRQVVTEISKIVTLIRRELVVDLDL